MMPMVPSDAQAKGTDGGQRHGDTAVAACLAVAAAEAEAWEADYRGAEPPAARGGWRDEPEDDAGGDRGWWKQPLGAGLRGSV